MDLENQIQIWRSLDDDESIIEALSALDVDDLTPQLVYEAGKAYCNLANGETRELMQIGLDLLSSVALQYDDNHDWNYRMGYANYWLDREGDAIPYFQKALELKPNDTTSQQLLDDCQKRIALPAFNQVFRERVESTWRDFLDQEASIRTMMKAGMANVKRGASDDSHDESVAERMDAILSHALYNTSFEMGFDGTDYELTLTCDAGPAEVFKLKYFKDQAPKKVFDHWKINLGRQVDPEFTLEVEGTELTAEDILIWPEWQQDGVIIKLYCETFDHLLKKDPDQAAWAFSVLLDHTLGEICALDLVNGFTVLETPMKNPGIPLTNLPTALYRTGCSLSNDITRMTDIPSQYENEPEQDERADWRLDIAEGVTNCPALLDEYYEGEDAIMNSFHNDGAVPAFICWPIEGVAGGDDPDALNSFSEKLEAGILEQAGSSAVSMIGHATGVYAGYLDFIAWDLPEVLEAAEKVLHDLHMPAAAFHTFRREGDAFSIVEDEEAEDIAASEPVTD